MSRKRYAVRNGRREIICEAETPIDAVEVFIRRMAPGDILGSMIKIYPIEEGETRINYGGARGLTYYIDFSDPWLRSLAKELSIRWRRR